MDRPLVCMFTVVTASFPFSLPPSLPLSLFPSFPPCVQMISTLKRGEIVKSSSQLQDDDRGDKDNQFKIIFIKLYIKKYILEL